MKITQNLVITDPESFAKGDYDDCFNIFSNFPAVPSWIDCGEVTFEVSTTREEALQLALQGLEQAEKNILAEFEVEQQEINRRKQELLALPAPGDFQ